MAKMIQTADESEEYDEFVPDTTVAKELNVSFMTLHRWTHRPEIGFPPAIKINGVQGRNYRSRKQLEQWKKKMLTAATQERVRRAGGGSA